jgi:hypothetical protein
MAVLDNRTYLDAVAWARQILNRAGLPTDLNLVEAQGFRKGEDIEWYAAAILRHWFFVQSLWAGGINTGRIGRRDRIVIRGRVQTLESLTAELDRLISKSQVLVDPISKSKRPGGKVRGIQQTAPRKEEWAKWQEEANKIWAKRRTWSKSDVAKRVQKKFPNETARTIRHRIKKPSS